MSKWILACFLISGCSYGTDLRCPENDGQGDSVSALCPSEGEPAEPAPWGACNPCGQCSNPREFADGYECAPCEGAACEYAPEEDCAVVDLGRDRYEEIFGPMRADCS